MDGLTVTCRTCGVKTSFDDAGSHVCGQRPLQQYAGGYRDRAPRRSEDSNSSRRLPSNRSESGMSGRDYPPSNRQRHAENRPSQDDLSLGPTFDLGSLKAPHSYKGPYGSVPARPGSRGVGAAGSPPPQQRGPPRPQMQRNPYDSPRNAPQYDQFPPRQQASPRQRYAEDLDYSRPPRLNPPPGHPLTRTFPGPPSEPMYGPPMNRPYNDPRSRAPEHYQRMSPDRRNPSPRGPDRFPEPRYENSGPQGRRSEENYDRNHDQQDSRRDYPPRGEPYLPTSKSMQSMRDRSLDPPVEETELWHQIRARAADQKSRSISSSRSTDSETSRSNRSDNTLPSSAASPISPAKSTDYPVPLTSNSLKKSSPGLENLETHSRGGSETSTKVSMPVCRACNETIRGRSLASQDGKLSGRYHKRCFCCTTCQKPFDTASFYVFEDRPYCKKHYHVLNHSTCTACGEGVEGQCLQLEDATIRHPTCFTCTTCHIQLDEDYFESSGLPYCDRHARLMGKKKDMRMEKRKTRLLVM